MTAREMLPAIGAEVHFRTQGLRITCLVIDVKHSYGTPRVLVKPVCGEGEIWVNASSVEALHATTEVV